jgi:intracellular sulfur oxidation DsrE/DsrF family protein
VVFGYIQKKIYKFPKQLQMKKILVLLILYVCFHPGLQAQPANKDTAKNVVHTDSARLQKFFAMATYPLIKNSKMSGVIPVKEVQEMPDPSMQFKLLIEMTLWSKDSSARKEINAGLAEVGRLINLHVAAGVPKENIHVVIVIHGPALNVYLDNQHYRKKFNTDNPNLDILKQMHEMGTKFLACGQAEYFFGISKEEMIPEAMTALSAQVVVSNYQLKGYVLYHVDEDK